MPVSEQGLTADRYTLIPRTLIFLTRGAHVLLIKGAPHKRLWANLYNGIGGHVEAGENLLSAARRELFEETALIPTSLWLCGMITIDTGQNPGIGIFVFRGECPAGDFSASAEGTLAWLPISQALSLPLVEDLPVLLPKVLAARPEQTPFAAQYRYDPQGRLVITFDDWPTSGSTQRSKAEDLTRPVIEAAGGLLWRENGAERQIAIIHRPNLDDWVLPKGKREPGETWQQTALREVREETGYQAELLRFAGAVSYVAIDTPKVVLYWHMRPSGAGAFHPNKEVDALVWLSLDQALANLTYADEKEILRNPL
jgi:8-oxo-dGTP diphosphatase